MTNKKDTLYIAAMLLAVLLCALFTSTFGIKLAPQDSKLAELYADDLTFNDGWTIILPDGTEGSVTLPVKVSSPPNTPVTVYKTLGDDFEDTMCITLVNFSQTVRVAIDDTVVYEDTVQPNQPIGSTPPPGRTIVRLSGDNAGKTLAITVVSPRADLGGGIDVVHAGTGIQLLFHFYKAYFPRLLCDLVILATGIFLIIFGLCIRNARDLRYSSVYLGAFAVMFASFLRYGTAGVPFIYITTFYAYMTGLLSLMLCALPLMLYYRQRSRSWLRHCFTFLFWCYIANFATVLLMQLLLQVDLVDSLGVTHLLLFASIVTIVVYHLHERRLHSLASMEFESLGLLVMAIFCSFDLLIYSANPLQRLGFFSRLGILSYLLCMVVSVVLATNRRGRELRENEQLLNELETRLMLSQLSPHFIYNSLTSIRYLCESDTNLAVQSIDTFSDFLRGVLDSLSKKQMITFKRDLDHLQSYLGIEQVRFGTMLQVEYDIQVTDFVLPALTLQPLVENAVRHGVTKRDEGGTIVISTYRDKGEVVITIADDGVGCDPEQWQQMDSSHVGLRNVRKRIEMMCGGSLYLQSTPNAGTTVTVHLPEKEENNDDTGSR